MAFGSLLHLALLALRCRMALRSGVGSKMSGLRLNLPTGQLKLEASIKLLRQPEGSNSRQEQEA